MTANRLMEKLTLVREEHPTNERRSKVVRGDAGNVMEVRECSSKKASSSMLVVGLVAGSVSTASEVH